MNVLQKFQIAVLMCCYYRPLHERSDSGEECKNCRPHERLLNDRSHKSGSETHFSSSTGKENTEGFRANLVNPGGLGAQRNGWCQRELEFTEWKTVLELKTTSFLCSLCVCVKHGLYSRATQTKNFLLCQSCLKDLWTWHIRHNIIGIIDNNLEQLSEPS